MGLVALGAAPALAGESFLSRDAKINEAVPYGRDVVVTPATAVPQSGPGDETRPAAPADTAPSATPRS